MAVPKLVNKCIGARLLVPQSLPWAAWEKTNVERQCIMLPISGMIISMSEFLLNGNVFNTDQLLKCNLHSKMTNYGKILLQSVLAIITQILALAATINLGQKK